MNIATASPSAERPSIVIVEDDPGVRRSMQLLLQGRGFDVRAYAAGTPLLADTKVLDAACLVADYRLEDLDGPTVLTRLRALGWYGPAILITAYPAAEVRDRARRAGFERILEKPLREHVLVSTVASVIGEFSRNPT